MLNKDTDWEAIVAFCHKVNRDLEGPQTAVRLLVHKIQSPQERESLLALTVSSILCLTYCCMVQEHTLLFATFCVLKIWPLNEFDGLKKTHLLHRC